ncbi:MAG TPA: MopE-related protein [Polyangiales bacterium]|nr:MopE-related protein [Polyangiales bacterium]
MCEEAGVSARAGVCGCGRDDTTDSDGDSVPDCVDFCPGEPDQRGADSCNCAGARGDADGDGTPNCLDRCPYDAAKRTSGICGCGITDDDSDGDGTPDCTDGCPDDPAKAQAGDCGCGVTEGDTDLDGQPDCVDMCDGVDDGDYVANDSCGAGYCRTYNIPSSCTNGVETACQPALPLRDSDPSCDGIDDDCDGRTDEDAAGMHSCGVGACLRSGAISCNEGELSDSCTPSAMLAAEDATCDGVDDDCDGAVDENVATLPSTCTAGACAASGTIACVGGQLVDSCDAMDPVLPNDPTCNNLDEDCDGNTDENFASSLSSCGQGECARMGMISCVNGATLNSCRAGVPSSLTDASCDGRDEDCDGKVDENYVTTRTNCGAGVCARTGLATCAGGSVQDSCVAGSPARNSDDATVPGNGLDDDCDGTVDEDVPPCDTTPRAFEAGTYMNIAVPGGCSRVNVRLWGGGGGAGEQILLATGGEGGAGGYASATLLVATPIQLYVGNGAASGCNAGGTNSGSASYAGGSGGSGTGANGADGVVAGGGSGGVPGTADRGGDGYFGGGGGGQGRGGLGASGDGGGGGAATVLLMNGMRAVVAGGGGGGGGSQAVTILGSIASRGGRGGSGCGGNGLVDASIGGGGGGGGMCQGAAVQAGSGINPAFPGDIPSGRARGGAGNCTAGGNGYAILTFAP